MHLDLRTNSFIGRWGTGYNWCKGVKELWLVLVVEPTMCQGGTTILQHFPSDMPSLLSPWSLCKSCSLSPEFSSPTFWLGWLLMHTPYSRPCWKVIETVRPSLPGPKQHGHHLGIWWKDRLSRFTQDPLNSNLYFNNIPRCSGAP